jgi:lipopolysaccharide export system protein LptA
MTLNHWWTTLVALLLACWAGTVWAQDKAKCPCKTPEPACCADRTTCPADKSSCCDKCDNRTDTAAGCCDKCCGCCKEAQSTKAKTKQSRSNAVTPIVVVVPLPSMMPYPPMYPEPTGPYGFPGYPYAEALPPPAEMPYGFAPPAPPPATAAVGPMPAAPAAALSQFMTVEPAKPASHHLVFRAVTEDGQGRLEIHSGDLCAICENLVFKSSGGTACTLCVGNKQVHLHGPAFKASADSITRVGQEERFILEGHVSLKCDRDGQHADVTAERVVVNLAEGSFEVKPATKSTSATPVVVPASAAFDFFIGTFH